jgi:hypothetical protein
VGDASSDEENRDSLFGEGNTAETERAPRTSFHSSTASRYYAGPAVRTSIDSVDDALIIEPPPDTQDGRLRMSASPPLHPGVGHAGKSDRPASRMRSYLTPLTVPGGLKHPSRDPEVQTAAITKVIAEQKSLGGEILHQCEGTAGYDLEILVSGDEQPRMVAVKGLKGAWDAQGVALSPEEMKTADTLGRRYSLMIVEFALDDAARITELTDPANSVDEFRLDSGWRALGICRNEVQTPVVGMTVSSGGTALGIIQSIESFGIAQYLTIVSSSGEVDKVYFDGDVHTLTHGELADG